MSCGLYANILTALRTFSAYKAKLLALARPTLPTITIIYQIRQAVANDKSNNAPHDLAVLSVITSMHRE